MSQPWTAQHRVDERLAQQLIESQFPNLAPANVQFIGEGWDNVVYRVNHNYLFRFPRRKHGVEAITVESILPLAIAKYLPLPIPIPIFFGAPSPAYPSPFLGYRFLPGQNTSTAKPSMMQRTQLAQPLAHFLKALHAIDAQKAFALGATDAHGRELDVPLRVAQAHENVKNMQQWGIFAHCNKLSYILNMLDHVRDSDTRTLTHSDLHGDQLLLDARCNLTSVIDWGNMHISNPAIDLAILFSDIPHTAHRAFFAIYGTVKHETLQLALLKALYHHIIMAYSAHAMGNANELTEALTSLQLIVESAEKYM